MAGMTRDFDITMCTTVWGMSRVLCTHNFGYRQGFISILDTLWTLQWQSLLNFFQLSDFWWNRLKGRIKYFKFFKVYYKIHNWFFHTQKRKKLYSLSFIYLTNDTGICTHWRWAEKLKTEEIAPSLIFTVLEQW